MVPAPVPPLAAQLIEHSELHAKLDELGYDDDLAADRVVGATDSCVPGSKGCLGPRRAVGPDARDQGVIGLAGVFLRKTLRRAVCLLENLCPASRPGVEGFRNVTLCRRF
jgi:hypothetical protein